MKTSSILWIALLLSSAGTWAQGPGSTRPLFDFRKKKVDEETKTKAIDAAKSAAKQVPDEVKDKAKELLISPEAAEMRQKALQAAQALMQNATAPTTATTAPAVAVAETPPPVGPQPKPLQPLNLDEAPKATKGQILITAQKSAFFDANLGYGIYTGDVKVRHPRMYIECEELELYMAKQDGGVLGTPKPTTPGPAAKDLDILAPPNKAENTGTPIEKAYARGPMVTIEKVSETGELQIGHCKDLYYDGKNDVTTLRDWPQVQAGNKLHQSTEPGCVMIIDKGGKLTTTGGHRTIILQGEEATPRSRSGMAPATTAPAPSPQ
ncbi:hypothetical protein [Prosthecobacter sp.]|uniref:hypothetical protein n=1 Tax=Prosthecobacter sp. TaxID=1965333 RepID=UPI002AB991BD|nr:hypothetical protein [Prosthecobacter sp.]MDZ4401282.1 hypothetical protein [Prosthecobacter sp.]